MTLVVRAKVLAGALFFWVDLYRQVIFIFQNGQHDIHLTCAIILYFILLEGYPVRLSNQVIWIIIIELERKELIRPLVRLPERMLLCVDVPHSLMVVFSRQVLQGIILRLHDLVHLVVFDRLSVAGRIRQLVPTLLAATPPSKCLVGLLP